MTHEREKQAWIDREKRAAVNLSRPAQWKEWVSAGIVGAVIGVILAATFLAGG